MKLSSSDPTRRSLISGVFLVTLALLPMACGDSRSGKGNETPSDRLLESLTDDNVTAEVRLQRIAAEGTPGRTRAVFPLLRVIKHPSHVSFLIVPDDGGAFGYKVAELKDRGPDVRAMERLLAVCALERIGSYIALPDLLLAIDDSDHKVRAHAARALIRFGVRDAAVDCLLKLLDEKAYGNETANEILEAAFEKKLGFGPDIGMSEKERLAGEWRKVAAAYRAEGRSLAQEGAPYRLGMDPEADRRLRFFVDMVGQFQFKFHEQARLALQRLGSPALPFLLEGVERSRAAGNPTARAAIAQVLSVIDHPNARQMIDDLLADSFPTVRSRAIEARAALGGAGAVESIAARLRDEDVSVRLSALRALASLRTAQAAQVIRAYDPANDENLAELRIVSLFEATTGKDQRDEVLAMLVDGELRARNRAHAALLAVTGEALSYDPTAAVEDRRQVAAAYRAKLSS